MASPQKEDGYTPIANELFESILSSDFSKRQLLVIMAIARMTYGFSKKSDALSTVQIANMLHMNRPDVSKTLKELVELNVVSKHETGRQSHGVFVSELSINKDYESWETDSKTPPVIDDNLSDLTGSNLPPVTGSESLSDSKIPTDSKTLPLTGSKNTTQRVVKHHTHKAIQKQEKQ